METAEMKNNKELETAEMMNSQVSSIMCTQLVEIEPHELNFKFEAEKQISCVGHLANVTDQYVAFKFKTTSPKKYFVRPNVGIIKPKSTCEFTVTMQAQKSAPPEMQCKDKFLIQSTVVPFSTTEDEITPGMFVKDNSKHIEEAKITVALADVVLKQEPTYEYSSPKEVHSPVLLPDNGLDSSGPERFKALSSSAYGITMQAQKSAPPEMQCKDKFLIQSTVVPFSTTEDEITPGMFVKDNSKHIEEAKITVALADVVLKQEPTYEYSSPKEVHSPVLLPDNGLDSSGPERFKALSSSAYGSKNHNVRGTTVAFAIWKDHITVVSDGRGVVKRDKKHDYEDEYGHVVSGSEEKLFELGNRHIFAYSGRLHYASEAYKHLVEQMGATEMRGKSMGDIMAAVNDSYVLNFTKDPTDPQEYEEFPASICVVGHDGVHTLGMKPIRFSMTIAGRNVEFICMGSGSVFAHDHIVEQLAKRDNLITIGAISELLLEAVVAASLQDCSTGGHLHRVEFPRGYTLSIDYDHRPHISAEIAKRYVFIQPYLSCALLVLCHFDPDDSDFEFNFQNFLKIHLSGIVNVILVGSNNIARVGFRLVFFQSSGEHEAAFNYFLKAKEEGVPVIFNEEDVVCTRASKRMFEFLETKYGAVSKVEDFI
ncbi:vesicle-associated protein 2-2 [Phtheirospermum japonicum]|uniref:Vesicle-associated protein 2-2 n=1 Tax=Phtheirospermum japonicum TaxID=374723 RepID=A0A830CWU5_9LAMI|nr:vesicle-associated protein 2-2 [Phtheirospermum japonicum]